MRDIKGVLIDLGGVVHEQFVWWGEKGGGWRGLGDMVLLVADYTRAAAAPRLGLFVVTAR